MSYRTESTTPRILHSPESRLSDEMQTRRSCKGSYEALTLRETVLHREHISREFLCLCEEWFQRKPELQVEVLNSYQLPQRYRGTLKFHWLQQTSIANQMVFIGFLYMTWHCCHKSNSCRRLSVSFLLSGIMSMRIYISINKIIHMVVRFIKK